MSDFENNEDINVRKKYGNINCTNIEKYMKDKNISINGLDNNKAEENIKKYGINQISLAKPKKWYNYFFETLKGPFNLILLGISFILFFTDVIFAEIPNYANIIVIFALVAISTFLEFFEEYKSNKAAEKLKELVETKTRVIRNGKEEDVPIKNVTVGDIIKISAGDIIPADIRIIESKELYVTQSSITGESDSVKKTVESQIKNEEEIDFVTDLDTICFMGTNVVSGSATAVIIYIGDNSYFGKVADTFKNGKPKTSFQKDIESISRLLIRFMIILIPIVFLLNAWKHSILISFTFAVAIAIGITPLLLPVILSSSLSKGAIRMSKKKTIVKKLDSIQSFGAMNILCTDKTGTLTEDKIVLEKYLNIQGEEDTRVLKHAFLNSYFQTGIKGNIDEAVIKKGLENDLEYCTNKYEVPFDFIRRRLSILVDDGEKKQLITKGAVEEILSICTLCDYKSQIKPLTNEIKQNIIRVSKKLNSDGFRVVAVCQKNDVNNIENLSVENEKNMVLIGFIGFLDPPKESSKIAISKLNKAGIRVIVLTGDNTEVTTCICKKVNINTDRVVTGAEIDRLQDNGLKRLLNKTNVFTKLSPIQKARIVRVLKEQGNVVGYMGDGINDSPSLTNSDVGISVDTAVSIAKETADIILLEKDLNVLLDGVKEGRRTLANLLKYIKLAISFNFGEVMSVIIASVLLPFFPITPIQLLVQSLLYDIGQLTLPFDNVDEEYLKEPKRLSTKSLKRFMIFMGPLSSCFDLIIFAILWFGFKLTIDEKALFQTIWFSYGIISNLVGMHIIRTAKLPILESSASKLVYISTISISILAIIVPKTFLGKMIGLVALPIEYIPIILIIPVLYCFVALIAKNIYVKKYREWI